MPPTRKRTRFRRWAALCWVAACGLSSLAASAQGPTAGPTPVASVKASGATSTQSPAAEPAPSASAKPPVADLSAVEHFSKTTAVPPAGSQMGWFAMLAVAFMTLVNAAGFVVLWFWSLRPMLARLDNQKNGLRSLENVRDRLIGELADTRAYLDQAWQKIDQFEKTLEPLEREYAVRHSQPRPLMTAPQPARLPESAPAFHHPFADGPAVRPEPRVLPGPAHPAQPEIPPAPPDRHQLGQLYLQEIGAAGGRDAAVAWDRCLPKIRSYFPQVRCQQIYWDRSAPALRFHDRPAPSYTDTGDCWLVQTDAQALLFFPALARANSRKRDIPGCQINSGGGALLESARLAEFTPPVVTPSSDGWIVQSEGTVEYH